MSGILRIILRQVNGIVCKLRDPLESFAPECARYGRIEMRIQHIGRVELIDGASQMSVSRNCVFPWDGIIVKGRQEISLTHMACHQTGGIPLIRCALNVLGIVVGRGHVGVVRHII